MSLPQMQRAILEQYQQFRANPPTLGRLIASSSIGYLLLALVFLTGIIFWDVVGDAFNSWLLLGFVFGYIFRDYQILKKTVRFWPTLSEVLDWNKIDAIVAVDPAQPISEKT